MSRLLFVVPPLTGHINPTVTVGAELSRRGHRVAWAGHPAALAALLPEGSKILPVLDEALDERLARSRERWLGLRGAAALKYFWDEFVIPLGDAMLPGVQAAVEEFGADLVIADQQAIAGPVAARRAGIGWATSATTSAELTDPLTAMPKVAEWVTDRMAGFQRAHGISDPADLRFSPDLVLVFSTEALVGTRDRFPGHYVFTGPAMSGRQEKTPFPWEWLDPDRRHVLASLGTLNGEAGCRFYATLIEAVAELADTLQLVVVAPPDMVPDPPPHVLVRDRVPQLRLLRRVDAVVSHGGHNTVCETLAHGLPLVLAPIRDDQPIVAQQVVDAGAGIRVRFGRVRAADLAAAVRGVLDEPAYRSAAAGVRKSFAAAGGAVTAADNVEKLLVSSQTGGSWPLGEEQA